MKFQSNGSLQGPLPIKVISSSSTHDSTPPMHSQNPVHLASFVSFNSTAPMHEQSEVETLKGVENQTDLIKWCFLLLYKNVRRVRYNRRPSTLEIRIWVFQQSYAAYQLVDENNHPDLLCPWKRRTGKPIDWYRFKYVRVRVAWHRVQGLPWSVLKFR